MLSLDELKSILRRRAGVSYKRRMRLLRLLSDVVERQLIPNVRFDLGRMNDADAILKFRFDVAGIQRLVALLCVPNVVITEYRDRCNGDEALCITLYKMSYPRRYYDMMDTFGRSRESLSHIFCTMVDLLYAKWSDVIYFSKTVTPSRLEIFAKAIESKGSPMANIFAFIDGSKFETCRITQRKEPQGPCLNYPADLQRQIYSGHKRRHCLNFQGLTAPDGLCIHFWGPIEGSRHDTTLLRESKLMEYLDINMAIFEGYLIYGDPAYGILKWICSGYKGNDVNELKKRFNSAMSKVRQAVEWSFGRMKTLWAYVTYKLQQKIMLQSVGKAICLAMLFTNCHCCYYRGNQISSYFNLTPPSLEDYLHL
ncbi:Aste57867_11373 [Aphanomyces stellatus]|uniref:Aste57867_11373 protein n=1 Tax=Aphanomyces stellatus TaxID=120398 RepID=A0A485KT87_9STRA|nr:hypothetical protein As57867_011331 [Aphanomyces stellatus]VFT88235.1 Aste57867_11373 [Aphanomyces stellatus]